MMTQWGSLTTALHSGQQRGKLKKIFKCGILYFLNVNSQDIFSISIEVDVSHCPTVECGAISKWLIELSNY